MAKVSYSCTALMGVNKAGTLKPDADGYYTVILGALDFDNSSGQVYPLEDAKAVFDKASSFKRRVAAGFCRGEYGHPKREVGQTFEAWLTRIMTIEETRIAMHISDVWLDFDSVMHNGKKVVTIFGKILPSGPYGAVLKDQLDNCRENVAFSLRSITEDYWERGKLHKAILDIACWDFVNEGGIVVAQKYKCPSLESLDSDFNFDTIIARKVLVSAEGLGLEANDPIIQTLDRINARVPKGTRPPSASW